MADQILSDLSSFGPELALTCAMLAAVILDLIFRRVPAVAPVTVLAGLIVALVLLLGQSGLAVPLFSSMVTVDPFSSFFRLLILGTAMLVVIFSTHAEELRKPGLRMGEYYALLAALTLGLMLMAGASNLLMIYLSIELSSITSYILTGYTRAAKDSSEASLKYLIFGALSSGLMLYGISLLYGLTGSMDIMGINQYLRQGSVSIVALLISGLLILAGLGYKISAVPFHFWTPDVYEGAPITITAYLSVASKAAGFAVLMRFFGVTFADPGVAALPPGAWATLSGFPWTDILAALAVITMTVGNLIALWQTNLKRMLAYSSIAHAGYILTGVVVLNGQGIAAVLVYFAVYFFMNLGAFYVVQLVANRTGSEDMEEYRGLGGRAPFLTVSLAIFLVSLTGLPPTAGFIGKLYLFSALLSDGWIWLAVAAALNSVISLYYYVRVIRNMFLRPGEGDLTPLVFGRFQTALVLLLLVPTLLFGVYFTPLLTLAQSSVLMLGKP